MQKTAQSSLRRLAVAGLVTGVILALAASFPARASAATGSPCGVRAQSVRVISLRIFKRQIEPARASFYKHHRKARARRAFVAGQQRKLSALKRAVWRCGKSGTSGIPDSAPDPQTPPCSPSLYSAPYTEMNEGTTNVALPLRPEGQIRAVMLFVDFNDLSATETTSALYDRLVPHALNWYKEVSYGHVGLDVTPVSRWVRMPRSLSSYTLRDGITWPEHHDYIADAVHAADPQVDFSSYQVVFVVSAKNSGVDRSPAFQAYPGGGIQADGTELRYGATFFDDTRGNARYAGNVLIHEVGHILGLPDLYDGGYNPNFWSLFRYAGSWDTMSWNELAAHFVAWEKWKLGWLDPSQLTCLDGPGEVTTTITPLERAGGLKAIVLPMGLSSAYVIEARKRIGEDSRLCDDGVLIYSVDATVRTGGGPVHVRAAQNDTNADLHNTCGPLYNAPFDKAKGEVAQFEDPSAGLVVQVLSSGKSGYRVHVTRTAIASQSLQASNDSGAPTQGAVSEGSFAPPQQPLVASSYPFGVGWDLSGLLGD